MPPKVIGGRKELSKAGDLTSAIAAIETFSPGMRVGSFAPLRAGGFSGNHLNHSSFMPAKSSFLAITTVALATLSR